MNQPPIPEAVRHTIQQGSQSRLGIPEEWVPLIRPLPGRCLLRVDEPEERVGSIIVPETARDERTPLWPCRVLAVAPKKKLNMPKHSSQRLIHPQFVAGDHVLVELTLDDSKGRKVIMVRNERVAAVLDE